MIIAGTPFERGDALGTALRVAKDAADIVRRVYEEEFAVEYKGVNDPVTRADREANGFIAREVARAYPRIPIVAEESDPASFFGFERSRAAWFVDPLDGTREFVARNGEFAVMIGLAEDGRATLGVLVLPLLNRVLIGAEGIGAFEIDPDGTRRAIRVSSTKRLAEARVVVSRSHRSPEAIAVIARLGARAVVGVGSAGVKGAQVASAEADLYAHPGMAGKLWDACAPDAIVRAAGGVASDARGDRIAYGSAELGNAHGFVVSNGFLHDAALAAMTP